MLPIIAGLIAGGALGAGKYFGVDRGKEERDRKLQAATALYSPWTGMQAQPVHEADLFGDVLQGATAGGQMGQNVESLGGASEMQKRNLALLDSEIARNNAYTQRLSPGQTPAPGMGGPNQGPQYNPWSIENFLKKPNRGSEELRPGA